MLEHFVPKTTQKIKCVFREFFFYFSFKYSQFSAAILAPFYFFNFKSNISDSASYNRLLFSMTFRRYNGPTRVSKLISTRPFNPVEMSVSCSFDVSNVFFQLPNNPCAKPDSGRRYLRTTRNITRTCIYVYIPARLWRK